MHGREIEVDHRDVERLRAEPDDRLPGVARRVDGMTLTGHAALRPSGSGRSSSTTRMRRVGRPVVAAIASVLEVIGSEHVFAFTSI